MRILIFGGNGMAGHMLRNYLRQETSYEVFDTVRDTTNDPLGITLNVMDEKKVAQILDQLQPDIVINAVGILNDHATNNPSEAIYINSLFPHHLKKLGETLGYRLIHISTDCVFLGEKGNYSEHDIPDGTTIYARTKSLGEIVDNPNTTTVRTSIIGPELKKDGIGLFHWFMTQQGHIRGYQNVFWNGVTTLELAKAIDYIIQNPIYGLVHLAAPEKISKFNLLHLLKAAYQSTVHIEPCDKIKSDKTLINTRDDFSFTTLTYPKMIEEQTIWMKNQFNNLYIDLY